MTVLQLDFKVFDPKDLPGTALSETWKPQALSRASGNPTAPEPKPRSLDREISPLLVASFAAALVGGGGAALEAAAEVML